MENASLQPCLFVWFRHHQHFNGLWTHVLLGMHRFTAAYLDDIVIHGANWEDHLDHLKQVFERLQAAGFRIKKKKCNFAVNNCVYLGYVVGGGKIKPMECKIQAVREYKQPQTKKQVRAFWGLCRVLPQIRALLLHHCQPSH